MSSSVQSLRTRVSALLRRLSKPEETVGELFTVVCKNGSDAHWAAPPGPLRKADARSAQLLL